MIRYMLLATTLVGSAVGFVTPATAANYLFVTSDAPDTILETRPATSGGIEIVEAYRRPEDQPAQDPPIQRRIASIAQAPDGTIYLCSGLDPYVFAVRDGVERIYVSLPGRQVRHVAFDRDTLYVSVFRTPSDENNFAMEDGRIYAFPNSGGWSDYLVRQDQVGAGFWGAFTVFDGRIYIGASRESSAVYELRDGQAVKLCDAPQFIHGLLTSGGGDLLMTQGDDRVPRLTENDRGLRGTGPRVYNQRIEHLIIKPEAETPQGSSEGDTVPSTTGRRGAIQGRLRSSNPWGMIVLHRADNQDGVFPVDTARIAADGRYAFTNLEAGVYFVTWDEGRAESGARVLPYMQRVVINGAVVTVDFRFE